DRSSTVSFSGKRVATTRARRSSRSAWGIAPVSGRIAVASADFSVMKDMWAPNVWCYGADLEVVTPTHRPRVGAGKTRSPRFEAKRNNQCTPGYKRPSTGASPELDLGLIGPSMRYRETEHLRVLIANERKDRLALVAP